MTEDEKIAAFEFVAKELTQRSFQPMRENERKWYLACARYCSNRAFYLKQNRARVEKAAKGWA
jgi:hypothetical protein